MLKRLLLRDFGLAVDDVVPIQEGFQSKTFLARCKAGDAIVRINDFPLVFRNEVALYEILGQTDVPIPKVLGYRDEYPEQGHATIVLSRVPGAPLSDQRDSIEQSRLLWRKAGAVLRSIHDVALPGFGHLHEGTDQLGGIHTTWANYLAESNGNTFDVLRSAELLGPKDVATVESSLDQLLDVRVAAGRLLHNDFHGVHVFAQGNDISGVIDWGRALSGDPRHDLALSLFFLPEELHEVFVEGYGHPLDDPIVQTHQLVIAAQKLAWRCEMGLTEQLNLALVRLRRLIEQRPV